MPRLAGTSIPKYRKHRPTAQAVVTIGGVDHYLGPHGTKASHLEYDRLIAEWMANGRQAHVTADNGLTRRRVTRQIQAIRRILLPQEWPNHQRSDGDCVGRQDCAATLRQRAGQHVRSAETASRSASHDSSRLGSQAYQQASRPHCADILLGSCTRACESRRGPRTAGSEGPTSRPKCRT